MSILQIELSDAQRKALDSLAEETGKSPQAIVKEALEEVLRDADTVDWRAALAAGEGIWADRDDLPDFEELRKELDRNLWDQK
jgi:predicted transcriptional regulator